MKNYMNKKDIKIILGIIVFSLILMVAFNFYNSKEKNVYAEISYNGNVIKNIPLNKNGIISIKEQPAIIFEVKDKTIAFIKSDCPDKVCVNTGYIKSGFAACLPNHIVLKIVNDKSEIDGITH